MNGSRNCPSSVPNGKNIKAKPHTVSTLALPSLCTEMQSDQNLHSLFTLQCMLRQCILRCMGKSPILGHLTKEHKFCDCLFASLAEEVLLKWGLRWRFVVNTKARIKSQIFNISLQFNRRLIFVILYSLNCKIEGHAV